MAAINTSKSRKFNLSAIAMLDDHERDLYVPTVIHYLDCEMNDQGIAAAYQELETLVEMLFDEGWSFHALQIVDRAIFDLHAGEEL